MRMVEEEKNLKNKNKNYFFCSNGEHPLWKTPEIGYSRKILIPVFDTNIIKSEIKFSYKFRLTRGSET
jgi:hypothetical protein